MASIDASYLRQALRLARLGYGTTSPNPMVGAVLVKQGRVCGRGFHHQAGGPHAEIEALRDAEQRGVNPKGATLYVTLEPCCTQGRTPPCTDALIASGIKRVVWGATDPNPLHHGRAAAILKRAEVDVTPGVLAEECTRLNAAFNHWIVHRTPWVTVKAAMTLDGKIATAAGESKWITGEAARAYAMRLRQGADAILVGINTILADDPSLTVRGLSPRSKIQGPKSIVQSPESASAAVRSSAFKVQCSTFAAQSRESDAGARRLRRIVLDTRARTPLTAKVVSDELAALTTIVVSKRAPARRVAALAKRVRVLVAPTTVARSAPRDLAIDLVWLMQHLGAEEVTGLLVEGGGEVNAAFLLGGFANRIAFFYAPKILGGRDARRAVAGEGARTHAEVLNLTDVQWQPLGPDWLLTALIAGWPARQNENSE